MVSLSVLLQESKDGQRWQEDACTLPTEASRWMLSTSPTCAAGCLTSVWSSSTSTQSTGSCFSCSSVSSCTTSSFETLRSFSSLNLQWFVFQEKELSVFFLVSLVGKPQVKPVILMVKNLRNRRRGYVRRRNLNNFKLEICTNVWKSLQCRLTDLRLTSII